MRNYILFVCALFIVSVVPSFTLATTTQSFEVSGWIPYWRAATGTLEVMPNLDKVTEVNPFGYTVKDNGTLFDAAKITKEPWASFIAQAKAKKVRVIPSIMWSNGQAIDAVLSNKSKRLAHVNQIAQMVKSNGFDGVDIDYENKLAETNPYFAQFLKELYAAMGNKWVMCTIEARTPPDSLYTPDSMPAKFEYANDYVAINKYCDRVRLMTYDQESADLLLNASSTPPYSPIADTKWVEKVVNLAAQTISKKKLMIGIATYGYEYDATAYSDGYTYDLLWSFNPRYGTDLAKQYGITPLRNSAGEMSFSYTPTSTTPVLPAGVSTSTAPTNGDMAAMAALAMVSSTNTHTTLRFVDWSDAGAIADKIALAKKLGVRGVSIFKLDGGEDPNIWTVLTRVQRK